MHDSRAPKEAKGEILTGVEECGLDGSGTIAPKKRVSTLKSWWKSAVALCVASCTCKLSRNKPVAQPQTH